MSRRSGLLGRSPILKKVLIFALGAECCAFLACYHIFTRMNLERDLRLYMHNNYPSILDQYYKIHELGSDSQIREKDMYVWKTTGKVL